MGAAFHFRTSMSPRLAVLAMLGAVLIYGANFSLSRHATQQGLTPSDLVALRFGVGSLLMLPFFIKAGWRDCAGLGWRRGAILAVMSGAPMAILMNTGIALSPAAHGAAIQPGVVTVMGAVGSAILFGVRPPRIVIIGLGVVLCGLACVGLAGGLSGSRQVIVGDICFFLAGILWGLYPLMLQRWGVGAMAGTAVVSVLNLAFLPIYAAFLSPQIFTVDAVTLGLHAVNQGVFNMVLALWLWGSAVRAIGAAKAQRFPPLIPVIGMLLAIPILGEWPGPLQIAGVTLIVGGLLFANFGQRLLRLMPRI